MTKTLRIPEPKSTRVYQTSDGQTHATQKVAKMAEIVLVCRKAIMNMTPSGTHSLTPGEAAELFLMKGEVFSPLIQAMKRAKQMK